MRVGKRDAGQHSLPCAIGHIALHGGVAEGTTEMGIATRKGTYCRRAMKHGAIARRVYKKWAQVQAKCSDPPLISQTPP